MSNREEAIDLNQSEVKDEEKSLMNGTQKNNVGTWNDWNKDRIYALEIILINIFSFIQNNKRLCLKEISQLSKL